jgi:hypothetical protein
MTVPLHFCLRHKLSWDLTIFTSLFTDNRLSFDGSDSKVLQEVNTAIFMWGASKRDRSGKPGEAATHRLVPARPHKKALHRSKAVLSFC